MREGGGPWQSAQSMSERGLTSQVEGACSST